MSNKKRNNKKSKIKMEQTNSNTWLFTLPKGCTHEDLTNTYVTLSCKGEGDNVHKFDADSFLKNLIKNATIKIHEDAN